MQNILFNNACLLLDSRQIRSAVSNKAIQCHLELSPYSNSDVLGSSYPRPGAAAEISDFYLDRNL